MLYLTFGFGSMFAPWMIKQLNPKTALILASIVYAIWIVSLAITTLILKNTYLSEMLGRDGIIVLVLGIALLCGPGCALLWVAHGKYLSDCTMPCL